MLPIAIVLIILSVALFIVIKSKTAKLLLSTLIVVVGVVFMHFGYDDYQIRQGGQVVSNQEPVQGESTDEESQDEKSSEKEAEKDKDEDEDKEDKKDSNQSSKSESNKQSSTNTSVDSLKPKYLQKLNNIQTKVDNIYYGDSTIQMKQAEGEAWQLWDDALNEIYGVLKTQLSTSEMDALRTKQRAWITYRDSTAESESAEFKGGTMEGLVYVSTRASLTKERCYELVNIYMK